MKFTEKEIRESRCDGHPRGYVWIHPAGKAVWANGEVTDCHVIEDTSERLTPDEAVRILRERGVIEDAPAFRLGDRVQVVGPIDKCWRGYVPDLDLYVGRVGEIMHIVEGTTLMDFGGKNQWTFPTSIIRHAKAEAAQPDKWAHIPTHGEWIHCRKIGAVYFVTAAGYRHYTDGGIADNKMVPIPFTTCDLCETITRDQAIIIFESNAAPDHIVGDNKMVSDELYDERRDIISLRERYDGLRLKLNATAESEAAMADELATAEARIASLEQQLADVTGRLKQHRSKYFDTCDILNDEKKDVRRLSHELQIANTTAEARIAVLEQQLADATAMALNSDECLNQSNTSHASCEDELYDARRETIDLRARAADMAKGIIERDSQLGELRQMLDDTTASEGVTGAQLATAEARIAELSKQASKDEEAYDDLMRHVEKGDQTIADLRISHARYELVRTLAPYQFIAIWQLCLHGEKFDAVVDELILERAKEVAK